MNINPNIWGPCSWDFFYYIALSYPKNPTYDDKAKYKNFFMLGGEVIPCEKCRKNFAKHIHELSIDNYLDSSYNLFTWVTKMQNKVRVLHSKNERTVDENFQYYVSKINNNENSSVLSLSKKEKILIGIICMGFLLFLFKKIKK